MVTTKKKGGKASRAKGDRFERECVHLLQAVGIAAERIPLSGSAGGSFCGDLTVPARGEDWRVECKIRAHGWSDLYHWLETNRALFIRRNQEKTLVVMRLDDFAELAELPARECPIITRSAS